MIKKRLYLTEGKQHKRISGDTVSGSHCNRLDLQLIVQANKVYSFMILSNCCGTTSVLLSRRQPDWRSKGSDLWRSKESDLWRSKESDLWRSKESYF